MAKTREKLESLGEACRDLLAMVAVAAPGIRFADLAGALQRGDEMAHAIDQAVNAGLLREMPPDSGRYGFSSDEMRAAIVGLLDPAELQRLQMLLVPALDASPQGKQARSAAAAQSVEVAHKGLEYSVRAGEAAAQQGAFEASAHHFEQALHALRVIGGTGSHREAEILVELAEAHRRAGEVSKANAVAEEAGRAATDHGDWTLLARAALARRGPTGFWVRPDPVSLDLLDRAYRSSPEDNDALRARVLSRLAASSYFDDPGGERRIELGAKALELARIAGPSTLLRVLEDQHLALRFPGQSGTRLALSNELVRLAEERRDDDSLARGLAARAWDLAERGDMARGNADMARYAILAAELPDPFHRWRLLVWQAMHALLEGSWSAAATRSEQSFTVGREFDEPLATLTFATQTAASALMRGRPENVCAQLQLMVQLYPDHPATRAMLSFALLLRGEIAESRGECERCILGGVGELPWNSTSLMLLMTLGTVVAGLRDIQRCEEIYDRLLPYRDYNGLAGICATVSVGPVARVLGVLASALERWDESDAHFRSAATLCRSLGSRPWLAYTAVAHSLMLRRRNQGSDLRESATLFEEGAAVANDLEISLQPFQWVV